MATDGNGLNDEQETTDPPVACVQGSMIGGLLYKEIEQ